MFRLVALAVTPMFVLACNRSDEQIKVYRLIKAPVEQPATEKSAVANPAVAKPQIKWDLPAGWSPGAASPMRYASFSATAENGEKADISIVTFPGEGGSDLDNVNRWRQQIGLPPIDASELNLTTAQLKTEAGTLATADLVGNDSRTVAAWLRRDGRSWFFKLTGPKSVVEKEKPNFTEFVQSVRF